MIEASANRRNDETPFGRAQIDGRFSLIDRSPFAIETVAGLVLRVRKGTARVFDRGHAYERVMCPGESLAADRAATIVVAARERTELELEWPQRDAERLSPGLEPLLAA